MVGVRCGRESKDSVAGDGDSAQRAMCYRAKEELWDSGFCPGDERSLEG